MNKYKCTRCGTKFEIAHKVSKSGAVCTPCFKHITAATSAGDYYARLKS